MTDSLVAQWNEKYFDGKLSPTILQTLQNHHFGRDSDDVQAFVERYIRFMSTARIGAGNFPQTIATKLGLMRNLLPSSYGGMIPPITSPDRHRDMDRFVQSTPWLEGLEAGTLLDLGCGFPPLTTIETAERLPNWQVVGADPLLPYYIVYDHEGEFASFDRQKQIQWWSPGPDNKNYLDPNPARQTFGRLLNELLTAIPSPQTPGTYEKNGTRLVVNPIQQYQRENLRLLNGGFGNVALSNLDVVRCFNVLLYFDRKFREQALSWVATILREGGLFICGANGGKSLGCRYCVYRREGNKLVEKEFAFSIDVLRSLDFVTWYTLHDDCYETNLLTKAVGAIRADQEFREEFDTHTDAILAAQGRFERDENGYMVYVYSAPLHHNDQVENDVAAKELIQRGAVDRAVEALTRAGFVAQRNCVDNISLAPGQFDV